jgi:hypothetical protein
MWKLNSFSMALYAVLLQIMNSLLFTAFFCFKTIMIQLFYLFILSPLYYLYALMTILLYKYVNKINTILAVVLIIMITAVVLYNSRDFNVIWTENPHRIDQSLFITVINAGCRDMFLSLSLLITTISFLTFLVLNKDKIS